MEPAPEAHKDRLMEMEMGTLLQDGDEEKWEAISDLDAFFARVYDYFNQRGLRCIVTSRIISLLTLVFTITLTVFLLDGMNWHGLLEECVDDVSCSKVRLVKKDALKHPGFFLILYVSLFSLYLMWAVFHFLVDLRRLLEMRALFRDKLHIDDVDLQAIQWDTVVQRIVELQQTSRLCIVKDQLTAHDIANRILRKENYMVAFVNRNLLPLQPLGALAPQLRLNMLTKTLEWNLYVCILDAMFDQQFRIRQSFTSDLGGLRRRFIMAGVLNLLLSPFIAAFMVVYFFLKHAEEIHHQRANASAFSRYYSRHAEWMMREFNELPHTFEARMHASLPDAAAYVMQFPAPLVSMIARFVTFLAGSLAAVLRVRRGRRAPPPWGPHSPALRLTRPYRRGALRAPGRALCGSAAAAEAAPSRRWSHDLSGPRSQLLPVARPLARGRAPHSRGATEPLGVLCGRR